MFNIWIYSLIVGLLVLNWVMPSSALEHLSQEQKAHYNRVLTAINGQLNVPALMIATSQQPTDLQYSLRHKLLHEATKMLNDAKIPLSTTKKTQLEAILKELATYTAIADLGTLSSRNSQTTEFFESTKTCVLGSDSYMIQLDSPRGLVALDLNDKAQSLWQKNRTHIQFSEFYSKAEQTVYEIAFPQEVIFTFRALRRQFPWRTPIVLFPINGNKVCFPFGEFNIHRGTAETCTTSRHGNILSLSEAELESVQVTKIPFSKLPQRFARRLQLTVEIAQQEMTRFLSDPKIQSDTKNVEELYSLLQNLVSHCGPLLSRNTRTQIHNFLLQ